MTMSRVAGRRRDAVTVLTAYLILLVAIPSGMRVAPLGAAGTPAQLLALAALAWWIYNIFQRTLRSGFGIQPVRIALVVVASATSVSYIVATMRPMDAEESTIADLGMVTVAAWAGIVLLANDGIPSRARFDVLLHRLAAAGGALGTLAIVQFVTKRPWVDNVSIPGLATRDDLYGFASRAGFDRPAATALHPIEFGAVITMLLPIAITLAMNDRDRGWLRRWYPVGVIGMATMMSISRSALLCAALGIVVLAMTWRPATQLFGFVVLLGFGAVAFISIPGLLGSLAAMFTGIGQDTSARSRTDSFSVAFDFVGRSPLFGRGLFTFLPRYRILDDQYLLLLIEIGVVGLLAVLGLLGAGIYCARRVRQHAADEPTRQLGQALVASLSAGAAGMALFDGFGFPMSAGMLFLLLGVAGAFWRLEREDEARSRQSAGQDRIRAAQLHRPSRRDEQRQQRGPAVAPPAGES